MAVTSEVAKTIEGDILLERYDDEGIPKGGGSGEDIPKMANSSSNHSAISIVS